MMNKKERQYKAKRAILNVLTGAGYEFLYEEFGVDDGSVIHNEVKSIISAMADKLYNPAPPTPRASRKQESQPVALPPLPLPLDTGNSEPVATHIPDKFYGSRRGRNRPA